MPKANRQKIKLLEIMELLRQQTDEEHPLLTSQIVKALNDLGISCDRRTLYLDINMLNEYGFEVQSRLIGHEKGYYCVDRKFSPPELKILMDAVQAAGFITPKKTEEFIDKIADLGGSHRAELLKSNMVCFNITKHTNESVYYNISELEIALQEKKKASFYYFDRDVDGSKIYRKNKKRYIVDPMALIFNDDNYYLMCFSSKYDGICNYRVDRMDTVNVEEDEVSADAIIHASDIAEYNAQAFKMYGGPIEDVVLEFDDKLIGVVQDKFGENTKMLHTAPGKCVASVKVQVAPTFWGWLFQFVGQMKIISPEPLMDEYRDRAKQVEEG
jgi:predicted DNA-binding transcriptional regulator YafY